MIGTRRHEPPDTATAAHHDPGDTEMAASPALPPGPVPTRPRAVPAPPSEPTGAAHVGEAVVVRIDSRLATTRTRPSAAQYRRRRLGVLAGLLLLVLFVVATARAAGAAPTAPDPIVGGHAVVEPGMTLWDVAAYNAPVGEDVRAYLHDLRELNGIDAEVTAWTVVALPPR